MTNAEFKALKAKIQQNKEKGVDMDKVVGLFATLTDAIKAILPKEIREVLEKYGYTEE